MPQYLIFFNLSLYYNISAIFSTQNIKRKHNKVFRIISVLISALIVTRTPCKLGDLQIGSTQGRVLIIFWVAFAFENNNSAQLLHIKSHKMCFPIQEVRYMLGDQCRLMFTNSYF